MIQSDTSVQLMRRDFLAMVASLSPESSQDEVLDVLQRISVAKQAIKELEAMAEESAIQWIDQNGDIVVGDVRYYVGKTKTTKCVDVRATMDAALTATGGDVDAMTELLSSGAWKHGACRKVLSPDDYERLFITTEKPDLKTDEPKRSLQRVDQRFVK
jgi:hypothetical protein